jgi:transposase-like protein
MSSYSVDLRRRIVSAVEGGMSKAQAARTFSVSLSSVKRYVEKTHRGESLAPKKRPGAAPIAYVIAVDPSNGSRSGRRMPEHPSSTPLRALGPSPR